MKNIIKKLIKEALDEALRDELPDYMINAVKSNNPDVADKFLDMDVPQHTELIPNIKIELNEPNLKKRFIKDIQTHFAQQIVKQFKETKLYDLLTRNLFILNYIKIENYKTEYLKRIVVNLLSGIESNSKLTPSNLNNIRNLSLFYSKNFILLQGKNNDINKPIYSNNKSNFLSFLKSFNTAFPDKPIKYDELLNDRIFQGLREPIINFDENVKDLAKTKLFLYITDKPADVLRMSVSNFYSSCQNMYSGKYKEKLLSNVFDKNSKIGYLIFDSSYVDNQGNKHPFTPIARTIIRIGENNITLFDQTYPKQMENEFYSILEKYTELRNQGVAKKSIYPYDYVGLPTPYMDKYKIKSNGESELENNERAVALADELGVDILELEEESDVTFRYGSELYNVYTLDEANEYALDYIRDNWTDYIGDGSRFYDLIRRNVLFKKPIYNVLNIDDNYLEDSGMSLEEYLDDLGIQSIWDFNQLLRKNNINSFNWYREGVTYDLDKLIRYFGGMDEIRLYSNANYDGRELYNNGYYIYRID